LEISLVLYNLINNEVETKIMCAHKIHVWWLSDEKHTSLIYKHFYAIAQKRKILVLHK